MAKCRVLKSWFWMGDFQQVGAVIENTPEWIAARLADGGLVELIEGATEPVIEQAVRQQEPETAVAPRQRARSRK